MAPTGEDYSIIVIGGGIMGSCAAYEASKRGQRTLLLEQFDFLHCLGSSHGESRTIRSTYPQPYYVDMALQSYRLWEQAQSEFGSRVHVKSQHLGIGPNHKPSFRSSIETCISKSLPHELLDPVQTADRFAGRFTIPDNWIGILTPLGGVLKPTKSVAMFQTLARARGAVLKDNVEVEDVVRDDVSGGVIVRTTDGDFRGEKCIITAGSWSRALIKKINGLVLPIQPIETHVFYWRIKPGFESDYSTDFPSFASYGDPYIYGTMSFEFPGLIKINVHGGEACDHDKRKWAPGDVLGPLKKWIDETFAGRVETSGPVMAQSCLYSTTPDEDFVLDFLGGEFGKDVVIGGGFSGHGFKMGPIVGRVLVDLVLDGETHGLEMEHFRIRRFQENPMGNIRGFKNQIYYGPSSVA